MEIIDNANLKYKFSSIYFYNSGHFLGNILIFVFLVFAGLEKSKKFNLFLNNLLLTEPFCLFQQKSLSGLEMECTNDQHVNQLKIVACAMPKVHGSTIKCLHKMILIYALVP